MKKTLYITITVAVLFVCGCASYYFISKINISNQRFKQDNQKFQQEQAEYIKKKSEECLEKFRKYYDRNNYDYSRRDDNSFSSYYGISNIKYSTMTNSCIQFFEYHNNTDYFSGGQLDYTWYENKRKIADETNKIPRYVCHESSWYSDNTYDGCVEGYNKELEKLGLK